MSAATTAPPAPPVDVGNNPLLLQTGLPKFQKIEASHVVPAIEQQLATFAKDFDEFEKFNVRYFQLLVTNLDLSFWAL